MVWLRFPGPTGGTNMGTNKTGNRRLLCARLLAVVLARAAAVPVGVALMTSKERVAHVLLSTSRHALQILAD